MKFGWSRFAMEKAEELVLIRAYTRLTMMFDIP